MPSNRDRRATLRAAAPKLHPTSQAMAYALAVAGPAPARTSMCLVGGAIGGTFVLSALAGGFMAPGLLFFAAFWAFNPARAVIVTSNSIVVMSRSIWNGKPKDVLAVAARAPLEPNEGRSGAWRGYRIGDDVVWMTKKEAAIAAGV